ncbi:MAG TPA: PDZ domain-containing protein, partial [Rectinemataceae bacterium]|nr:PDZ domain-containing protein [Rectinemataceae bacterium]
SSGRVSGVVFAGVPGYQGLNFAIPTSWLLGALPALYRGGKVEHPWLGYILDDADKGTSGLPVRYRSPSATPSIREGDVILSVDGRPLERVVDLQALLLERDPGDLVSILVQAPDGSRRIVLRALGSRPEHPLDDAIAQDTRDRLFPALLGMDVIRVPGGIFGAESYTISKVRAGSVADEAGLSEGDPFTLYGMIVHPKDRAALLQIHVKKRKAGFLDSIIQIPVPLDIPDFV